LLRLLAAIALTLLVRVAIAEGLSPERLGIIYNLDDPESPGLAKYYAQARRVPLANMVGTHLGRADVFAPNDFAQIRREAIEHLPTSVQSLALVWSRPFSVGCMSVTTAFAAGYRAGFCEPGCGLTTTNPLFDTDDWLPADTVGWWPAMLIPSADPSLARSVIQHGIQATSRATGATVYLQSTNDKARNVRAANYAQVSALFGDRIRVLEVSAGLTQELPEAIAFFTGAANVSDLARIHFLPGAVADHLTSTGGVLYGGTQMSALAWLAQGATASYGSVSEPCNHLEKFPDIAVFIKHYLRGETVLEAYWKSVKMPGQGLFIGEPLARPFAQSRP
jgi:uncharacterized protein (TIGR03790 family)